MIPNSFVHKCGRVCDAVKVSETKIIFYCVVCGKEITTKIYPTGFNSYYNDALLETLI